jgi:RNA polymerase sigma-70 factor (ECF subfamily)
VTRDDDTSLVNRVKEGDQFAFRQLVERYQERTFGIALGIVRNQEDAMDIAQEAFLKVHRNIDRFEGSSRFYTWLYRIVVNLCIDHTRRTRRNKTVVYDDAIDTPDSPLVQGAPITPTSPVAPDRALGNKELLMAVGQALERQSPKHREVIILREVEGLSYNEIAEVLDISVGTVMSRLHHARQNMQTIIRRLIP